ncbi:hypothetical protein Tco_1390530, partial [Tanacetum coccineum]
DYPHRALKNKWIVDSGCSRHMTGNKAYLAEYQDYNGDPVAFGGSKAMMVRCKWPTSTNVETFVNVSPSHIKDSLYSSSTKILRDLKQPFKHRAKVNKSFLSPMLLIEAIRIFCLFFLYADSSLSDGCESAFLVCAQMIGAPEPYATLFYFLVEEWIQKRNY